MSVLLAVFTCASCSPTLLRHWEFFKHQEADWNYVITTTSQCETPPDVSGGVLSIGADKYIDGPHLPNRLLDTIEELLKRPWDQLILAEYDTLFLKPIPARIVLEVASHLAGYQTWGSRTKRFYHNPWVFGRPCAREFLKVGREEIRAGDVCPTRESGQPSTPECSPDVFFGYICERIGVRVETDLWREFSRNSFDIPGDLEKAREAKRNGVHVIHGIKTAAELNYVLAPVET